MSIPGNAEPGSFSEQQQLQHRPSVNFSSAIPLKKRRFPIIRTPSPPPKEEIPNSEEQESKHKQNSKMPDEEKLSLFVAGNIWSYPGNPDASNTTSDLIAKQEVIPNNIESGQASFDNFAFKPQETKSTVSLSPVSDLGNKFDILSKEESSDRVERSSLIDARKTSSPGNPETTALMVKKEITPNNIESGKASLDIAVRLNPVFDVENKSDILSIGKSSDREFEGPGTVNVEQEFFSGQIQGTHGLKLSTGSMSVELSLGPKKTIVPPSVSKKPEAICNRCDKSDPPLLSLALSDDVSSLECPNRSNWDLNTTMDAWVGSTNTDVFSHKLADVKSDSRQDDKSFSSTAGTIDFSSTKGKRVLDIHKSNSSDAIIQLRQQGKTDLGLSLAREEHFYLSDNLVSTSASPNLSLPISAMEVNRIVKSEPIDNSRRDCSEGSSSSSNMGLLNFSFVKTEFFDNPSRKNVLQSSASPNKADCMSENGTVRLMQHQESYASSSSSSLIFPLEARTSCNLTSHAFTELKPGINSSSHFKNSLRNKEFYGRNDSMVFKPLGLDEKQSSPCNTVNSSVLDLDKNKLARVDEDAVELCQHGEATKDDGEKMNVSAEMNEEKSSIESDSKFHGNYAVDNSMGMEENICGKEDEEYEDGEVREPLRYSVTAEPIDVGKKTENLEFVACDSQNLQFFYYSGDKDVNTSDFSRNDSIDENREEISNRDDNSLVKVLDAEIDEKRTISVTPAKSFDPSGNKDFEESTGKEFWSNLPINANCGTDVELEDGANVKSIRSGENNSTLSKAEESFNGYDATGDSCNAGSKIRVVNLAPASVVTSPRKTLSVPNGSLTMRSGKEKTYSDLDGEIRPRGNRDEMYTDGGSSDFPKYRAHDQPLGNSRTRFVHGRGRIPGRFRSFRSEWDSNRDFASETCYGPSDYPSVRHKRASDTEIECDEQDGSALGSDNCNNKRKVTNDEFRGTSFRRLSPGYRDCPPNRRNLRRFPRNMSPNRSHDDKFMRHLSDDMNPVYNHPSEAMYDEFDGQGPIVRGNQNISTVQRKGYPRNRSKSPVRSETRSPPGRWYRMRPTRSPDRACFRDEMASRRCGSPSYAARHPTNDLHDADSGWNHNFNNPRLRNTKRRDSPERVFPRGGRRTDVLDSDGDEYVNRTSKFHDRRGDGNVDERRKFIERHGAGGHVRSSRPGYGGGGDGENFRFHANDGPGPYRFCPDADMEFVERGSMREREFNGRVKHSGQNYRPVERVWHDDGFGDGRVRRRC